MVLYISDFIKQRKKNKKVYKINYTCKKVKECYLLMLINLSI